jgi:cytochrome P450
MPLEDRDRFIGWVDTINEKVDRDPTAPPPPELLEAAGALFGYLQNYVDEKRAHPGDDMLSSVLALDGDDAWSNEEILGLCFLFVLAGLDTVTASIGFILLQLAQNPQLRRDLVADPSLVTPMIEEILRLELPAPTTPRVTTADVEVCGTHIPAGSNVSLCLATANRDTSRFTVPNEIHLGQADHGHLSFGGGIHRCLGSHLARRELRLVVEEWHKLIPEYDLAPGSEPSVVWPSGTLHLGSLPLVFPPRF